jgi:hypothetical protein
MIVLSGAPLKSTDKGIILFNVLIFRILKLKPWKANT